MTPAPAGYRPNVGIALFDARGKVWIGRRRGFRGDYAWQMPQGGIDPGEDPAAAAVRELGEEIGVAPGHVEPLGVLDRWITYDFPSEVMARQDARGHRGQAQLWHAFRFRGVDADIRLDLHTPEFDTWRWERLARTPALVVPFKQGVYHQVAVAFAPFAVPEA